MGDKHDAVVRRDRLMHENGDQNSYRAQHLDIGYDVSLDDLLGRTGALFGPKPIHLELIGPNRSVAGLVRGVLRTLIFLFDQSQHIFHIRRNGQTFYLPPPTYQMANDNT